MKLLPLEKMSRPAYPKRSARWSQAFKVAQKAGIVFSSAVVLSLSPACYNASRTLDEHDSGIENDSNISADADIESNVDADIDIEDDSTIDRILDICEPEMRISGEAPPPSYPFACSVEPPEDIAIHQLDEGYFWIEEQQSCGNLSSWAKIEVPREITVHAGFNYINKNFHIDIFDPEMQLVTQINVAQPCYQFLAEPGIWTIRVTEIDPHPERPEVLSFDFMEARN